MVWSWNPKCSPQHFGFHCNQGPYTSTLELATCVQERMHKKVHFGEGSRFSNMIFLNIFTSPVLMVAVALPCAGGEGWFG